MRLNDVMTRNPVLAHGDDKVVDVAQKMRGRRASSALVQDHGHLVGILTEKDLAQKIVAEGLSPDGLTVSEVMTTDPITAPPERDCWAALSLMNVKGIRHLPVCTDGAPVGIVSMNDLVGLQGSARVYTLLEGLDEQTRARLCEVLLWCAERVGLRREEIPVLPGLID
jgi:CBS domain-containing protein